MAEGRSERGSQPSARVFSTPSPPFSYWSPSLFLRLPILVRFLKNLFSHHEINFFHIFWSRRTESVPRSPAPIFSTVPRSLFSSGLHEYIYTVDLRKRDIPILFFLPSCLPNPTWLKLGAPSIPRTLHIFYLRSMLQ